MAETETKKLYERKTSTGTWILKPDGTPVFKEETKTVTFDTVLREWIFLKSETADKTPEMMGLFKSVKFTVITKKELNTLESQEDKLVQWFAQDFIASVRNQPEYRFAFIGKALTNLGEIDPTKKFHVIYLFAGENGNVCFPLGLTSSETIQIAKSRPKKITLVEKQELEKTTAYVFGSYDSQNDEYALDVSPT